MDNLVPLYPDTWYSRTLADTRDRPVLTGSLRVDCAVVGGGFAGLFTALQLARGGMRVAVLEAQSVGFGASGRNGGFVSDGFACGDAAIRARVGAAHAQEAWTDTLTFTLAPDAATEVKLVMAAGDVAEYAWVAEGGRINFDLHAHGDGQSIDYDRGRGATDGEGNIEAPFPGEHGWFWRNRDDAEVTVTLQLRGAYSEVVRSE